MIIDDDDDDIDDGSETFLGPKSSVIRCTWPYQRSLRWRTSSSKLRIQNLKRRCSMETRSVKLLEAIYLTMALSLRVRRSTSSFESGHVSLAYSRILRTHILNTCPRLLKGMHLSVRICKSSRKFFQADLTLATTPSLQPPYHVTEITECRYDFVFNVLNSLK